MAGIYIWNEPPAEFFGYTRWWEMAKNAAQAIHNENPDLLIFIASDYRSRQGFYSQMFDDPIQVPNVVYVFHYYYHYDYYYFKNDPRLVNFPFYTSYLNGNYATARLQLRQHLYDRWIHAVDKGYCIALEEFGFTANMPTPDGWGIEPGWPYSQNDVLDMLNDYSVSWNYFSWWPRIDGGCGASTENMVTLSPQGQVIKQKLS